ncbi:MAG: acyl-CoA thioesterase [Solirubrobacteraceae bacterium]|nr:acyl-CoA thioesterase [Solirubrobacteraceae bacterium]
MSERPSPPSRERSAYARYLSFRTRWMDNDQFGHLNNALYYSFFDSAVNTTLIDEFGFDPNSDASVYYVVETGCSFHAGVAFPGIVEVGVRVARLGSSSASYEIGVFSQGAELAAATGRFVHVMVDRETERPVPIPGEHRAHFERVYGVS